MRILAFLLIGCCLGCGGTVAITEPSSVAKEGRSDEKREGFDYPKNYSIDSTIEEYFQAQLDRDFLGYSDAPRLDALQKWKEVASLPSDSTATEYRGAKVVGMEKRIFEVSFADTRGQIVTKDIILLFYQIHRIYPTGFEQISWEVVRGNFGQELN